MGALPVAGAGLVVGVGHGLRRPSSQAIIARMSGAAGASRSAAVAVSSAATPSILPAPTTVALLTDTALPRRSTTTLPTFQRNIVEPQWLSTPSARRRSTHVMAGVNFQDCGTDTTSAPQSLSASAIPAAP